MRHLLILLAAALLATACTPTAKDTANEHSATQQTVPVPAKETTHTEPQFRKEGTLAFLGEKKDTLGKVEIEVAKTDAEREQGLMYRTSIGENTAMLFLFERAEGQSFWMKNTPTSLDILFISPENRILNIHEYTTPFSEASLPSSGLSNKVVEVVGGYCKKHGIKAGDVIAYTVDAGV